MPRLTRRSFTLLPLLGSIPVAPSPARAATEAPDVIAASSSAIELSQAETRVPLTPRDGLDALRQRLAAIATGGQAFIVLHDIHAAAQPGVIYQVYFGLPAGISAANTAPQPVGLLNFFAFAPPNPRRDLSRSYDVTETIRQLIAQNLPPDRLSVTFAANDGASPAVNSHASIGSIDLIIQ